jgi:hypothetical protein
MSITENHNYSHFREQVASTEFARLPEVIGKRLVTVLMCFEIF